jgi:hypothetical protein
VLPKAWGLLVKSFHTVRAVTGAFQSYADVGRMNEPQLDEFLADCPLQEWQKKELKNAHDKNKYYQGAIFWHRLGEARAAAREAALYLRTNGIFIPPGMKKKFEKTEDLAWDALSEHETYNPQNDFRPIAMERRERLGKEGEALLKSLEDDAHKRLWISTYPED